MLPVQTALVGPRQSISLRGGDRVGALHVHDVWRVWLQVSQKGKRSHGDGGDDGGSHLDPEDLMGLTVSQHVSLRVSPCSLPHTCCVSFASACLLFVVAMLPAHRNSYAYEW